MLRRAAAAVEATGLGSLVRRADSWHGTLVLAYHRIGRATESPLDRGVFSATTREFERHMAFLRAHVDVVDPLRLAERHDLPGRRVVVTFDDGYRDNWEYALPVLRAHRIPAAFFIATGFVDEPRIPWWDEIAWIVRASALFAGRDREQAIRGYLARYKAAPAPHATEFLDRLAQAAGTGRCPLPAHGLWMTWPMIRDLQGAGMHIGGHTVSHPVLARLPRAAQEREISGCKARLAHELGQPMRLFSYPVGLAGSFDEVSRTLVRAAGARMAFTCSGGWLARGRMFDPLAVPRVPVGPGLSEHGLRLVATVPQVFAGG